MAEVLDIDTFIPRVGEVFHVIVDDTQELRVQLTEVARLGAETANQQRQPFALVFHAPHGSFVPQQTYRLENAAMEPFECFLVPIEPDAQGARFEAVYT